MKLKKVISLVLLSALVSSSLSVGSINNNYAAGYDSSTSFTAAYSGDELKLYANNSEISRRSGYGSGVGRDFFYGSYGTINYTCRAQKSGETLQQLVDSVALDIAERTNPVDKTKMKGWLRTRTEVRKTSESDVATVNLYSIDYYANSIDLGLSSRTTKGDTLKKNFKIKNELQTSINNLSEYKMDLVTKINIYVEKKLVKTLEKGKSYKLSKKMNVQLVTIDADNLSYCIYLTSGSVKDTGTSASTKSKTSKNSSSTKKTSDKDVQTSDNSTLITELIFISSGSILLIMLLGYIKYIRVNE